MHYQIMIESREIKRSDLNVNYESHSINLRMAIVKLWDNSDTTTCSRFNVQIKIRNSEVESFIDDYKLDGGDWTVVAHSDHNPNGGHDIRDENDRKQLHVDVHPCLSGEYNHTYLRICGGKPPKTNDEAINTVVRFLNRKKEDIMKKFLNHGDYIKDRR